MSEGSFWIKSQCGRSVGSLHVPVCLLSSGTLASAESKVTHVRLTIESKLAMDSL